MKYINIFSVATAVILIGIGSANSASATSGACSSHGGVDCSAGADYDGSVICYDGWTGSSVSYYSMVMCSSYSSPSYSTPSCPLMSTYDSFSGTCKCMSGYIVGSDYLGNQTCVNANTECHKQIGIMSSYNSLSKLCECDYGYVLYDGQCTSRDSRCTGLYGYGAQYSSLKDQCVCKVGYSFNGGVCTLDLNVPSYSAPTPVTICAQNSTLSADGSCYCNDGYQTNSDKTACIVIACASNSTLVGNTCICNDGFVYKNGSCISYNDDCRNSFGMNAYGVKGTDGLSLCYCSNGYQWGTDGNSCVLSPPIQMPTTNNPEQIQSPSSAPTPQGVYDPSKKDLTLISKLRGQILLQVQAHGEAWYVNPSDSIRYYMPDGSAAYSMMRSFGLGIATIDLNKIPSVNSHQDMLASSSACATNSLASRLKGKILLQVQEHGEAWYIEPRKCRKIYMKDGAMAYQIMRYLGLGITNTDLEKIPSGIPQ